MPEPTDLFHWLDVERIAEELVDRYDDADPMTISFPRLRSRSRK